MESQRKISGSNVSLTGLYFSYKINRGVQFESSLERDYIILLEKNKNVKKYCEQPIQIIYEENNKKKKYTPDFLVHYNDKNKSKIVEIKYKDELERNSDKFLKRFEAAKSYCEEKGWIFEVITEEEIRTVKLNNYKFLERFNKPEVIIHLVNIEIIKQIYEGATISNVGELFASFEGGIERRAELIFTFWWMVSVEYVFVDFNNELSNTTEIKKINYE